MKVSELPKTRPPKVIIVGPVGCGKTALLSTFGEGLQVADMDDGMLTAVKLQDQWTSQRHQVDVKQFLEPEPQLKAIAWNQFKNYVYGLTGEIARKTYPFKAFAVDSLTAMANAAVASILATSGRLGKNPEIQHWGLAFTEIKNVLGVLRSLPIPIILTAHEQTKTIGKGDDAEDRLEIAISGKNLPTQVCAFFDEIWYMRVRPAGAGKNEYLVQTLSDSKITARSRGGLPDRTNTNVGMRELFKKIGYEV